MNHSEYSVKVTEESKQRHFDRLPDEVVISIFNKLVDLKLLFHCSLVSKRFSSLIPHVHSISFLVPRTNPNPNPNSNPEEAQHQNLPKKLFRFLLNDIVSKPLRFIRQIVRPNKPLPSSISAFYGDAFRSAVCFLGKFTQIRSLEMKLPSSSSQGSEVIKWRVKFGTKLETFLYISPTSLHEMNLFFNGSDEEDDEESELINNVLKHRVHLAFQCLKDAVVRHRMLLFLIEQHRTLRSVVISDSNKQGLLSVRDEKLVELRNLIESTSETLGSELRRIEVPMTAMEWYVPVLKLPLSGYVMVGATLVVMGMGDSAAAAAAGGDGSPGVTLAGSFEGDEEPFGEAVTEMMVNHGSKMKTLL